MVTQHRWWVRVMAGLAGVGLVMASSGAASANGAVEAPSQDATTNSKGFDVPIDPPFTLPYERPSGPVGSGIYNFING